MFSPERLSSGNYRVRVLDYVDSNKKRHFRSFTAPTPQEAELKAREFEISNRYRTITPYSELTIREAYQRYIDSKSARCSMLLYN